MSYIDARQMATQIETAAANPDTGVNAEILFKGVIDLNAVDTKAVLTQLIIDGQADEFIGAFYGRDVNGMPSPLNDATKRGLLFSAIVKDTRDQPEILGKVLSALDQSKTRGAANDLMAEVRATKDEGLIANVTAERTLGNFIAWDEGNPGRTAEALSSTSNNKTPLDKATGIMHSIAKADDEHIKPLFAQWLTQPDAVVKTASDGITAAGISDGEKGHLRDLLKDAAAEAGKGEAYAKLTAPPPSPPFAVSTVHRLHENSIGYATSHDVTVLKPVKTAAGTATFNVQARAELRHNDATTKMTAVTDPVTMKPVIDPATMMPMQKTTDVPAVMNERKEVSAGVSWAPTIATPGVTAAVTFNLVLQDSRLPDKPSTQTLMENLTLSGAATNDFGFGAHASATGLHFNQIGAPGPNNSQNMFFTQAGPNQEVAFGGLKLRAAADIGVSGIQTDNAPATIRSYLQASGSANYSWPAGHQIGASVVYTHGLTGPDAAANTMFDWISNRDDSVSAAVNGKFVF